MSKVKLKILLIAAAHIIVLALLLFCIYSFKKWYDTKSAEESVTSEKTQEVQESTEKVMDDEGTDNGTTEEQVITAPSEEDVLAARDALLEGMSQEEIERLSENIKVANQAMENAFFYDNLFERLEDEESLYWNYFDCKGEIQIGWADDGEPVIAYNRFDADNFITLIEEMKQTVNNEELQNDLQYIIDETKLAKDTHDMEHANNIYKMIHDLDYFLLRYGPEDVAKYTTDNSLVSTYYGMLSIYE